MQIFMDENVLVFDPETPYDLLLTRLIQAEIDIFNASDCPKAPGYGPIDYCGPTMPGQSPGLHICLQMETKKD